MAQSILSGDLSELPMGKVLLVENDIARFMSQVIDADSPGRIFGNNYKEAEDYRTAHPTAASTTKEMEGYAYFDAVRKCSMPEFLSQFGERDTFARYLIERGASLDEICVVLADNSQCGDGSISEIYLRRPIWTVFLAISNITSSPIALTDLVGKTSSSTNYRPFDNPGAAAALPLPRCSIMPGFTAVIPLALALGPLRELGEARSLTSTISDFGEYVLQVNLACLSEASGAACHVVGPQFTPNAMSGGLNNLPFTQEIHALDFSNVYTMDREMRCGSCPHLFAVHPDQHLSYIGELLASGERKIVRDSAQLPHDIVGVVIAELEDECSDIHSISIDGVVIKRDISLRQGEFLEISLKGEQELSVEGSYTPHQHAVSGPLGHGTRNRLICDFVWAWNQSVQVADLR